MSSCLSTMWKLVVALAIIMTLGEAQRSSYAPRRGTNSKLLPRFRKNETNTELGTRGGEEDFTATSTLPPELQGTLEDHEFVQQVSKWPEDRQPFWFKNRKAISSMRDRNVDGGSVDGPRSRSSESQRPRPQFQSSFQGSSRGQNRDISRFAPNDAYNSDYFYNEPFYSNFRRPYSF